MKLQFRGLFLFVLHRADGSAETWESENFLTEDGEAWVADQLAATPALDPMTYMGIGTGSGQTQADTTLDNEVARVAFESGYPAVGAGADDNEVEFYANFPAGTGTGIITEVAVFNASSGGNMLNYSQNFVKDKQAGDALEVHLYLKCGTT